MVKISIFQTFVLIAQHYSVLEILLPFLTIYVIMFALLQKTKLFGDPSKAPSVTSTNALLSVVIAAIVTFFTPFGISLIDVLSKIFTSSFIIILGLSYFIIFSVMIAIARGSKSPLSFTILALGALLSFFVIYSAGLLSVPNVSVQNIPPDLEVGVGLIAVLFFLVWFIGFSRKP